jgi:hypothetical protein
VQGISKHRGNNDWHNPPSRYSCRVRSEESKYNAHRYTPIITDDEVVPEKEEAADPSDQW